MALGPSASSRASRRASRDPNGCQRQFLQIARDWRTAVSQQRLRAAKSWHQRTSLVTSFASPRSIIFAIGPLPSSKLTIMLAGLMSRWTSPFLCTAARPAATCAAMFSANFTSSLAGSFNQILQGLSFYKLHCVEVTLSASPKVEDRGNVRVAHAGRRTRFSQETKAS